ncbi:hypothetical protein BY996DRAFT_4582918 [Phakopsora pachyrhizi]|uniref:Expressed protein n=1 Tax=Phakopsora pachyrhizi TaxID=170000 RepID=A0AAV0AQL5_PHAPC|nr:hypothetical protein BY996DRAFT_4582918 [Phakopsora pachyrhizi]CAH7670669.1 expressed protein [Phakopsora pachyrhizi]
MINRSKYLIRSIKTYHSDRRQLSDSLDTSITTKPNQHLNSKTLESSDRSITTKSRVNDDSQSNRLMISLFHRSKNFAPTNNSEALANFIDDSILFKPKPSKLPTTSHHSASNSSINLLPRTIQMIDCPKNHKVLRPGETENDLNPIIQFNRIRLAQQRYRCLIDSLVGCDTDESDDSLMVTINGISSNRFLNLGLGGRNQFGDSITRALSEKQDKASRDPGLEIVVENWNQIKQIQ